jgi:membrane peptidoglycan carboxypeptidase
VKENLEAHTKAPPRRGFLLSAVRWLVIAGVLLWLLAALTLVAARWFDPPTTAVHIERRLQAWIRHTPYHERYTFIPLSQISPNLQHAVVSAEVICLCISEPVEMLVFDQIRGGHGCGRGVSVWSR